MSDPKQDLARSVGAMAMKSAPPVTVTLWAWLGQNVSVMVGLATLIYIVAQLSHLLWKWRREARAKASA